MHSYSQAQGHNRTAARLIWVHSNEHCWTDAYRFLRLYWILNRRLMQTLNGIENRIPLGHCSQIHVDFWWYSFRSHSINRYIHEHDYHSEKSCVSLCRMDFGLTKIIMMTNKIQQIMFWLDRFVNSIIEFDPLSVLLFSIHQNMCTQNKHCFPIYEFNRRWCVQLGCEHNIRIYSKLAWNIGNIKSLAHDL